MLCVKYKAQTRAFSNNTYQSLLDLSHLYLVDSAASTFSNKRTVVVLLLLPCFVEIPVLNVNSIDPYQTPRSVVI